MASNRTATVLSLVALFIALGSGAYAAVSNLSANSVGAKQIKPQAVGTQEIAKEAVTAAELKAQAVSEQKLKDKAVTEQKVQEAAITAAKIAQAAINEQKIQEAAVTAAKIAEAAVTQQKIQEAAVTAAKIAQAAVTEQKIQDNAVTAAKLAADAKATLYTDNNAGPTGITTDTLIGTLTLPAGTYFVSANVQGTHTGTVASTRLECYLQQLSPATTLDAGKERLQANVGAEPIIFSKESLQGAATLGSAGSIQFRCSSTNASNIDLTNMRFSALRVSNIVAQ
jgi:hypothetical protein